MQVGFISYGSRREVTQKEIDDARNSLRSKGVRVFKKARAKRKMSDVSRKINR